MNAYQSEINQLNMIRKMIGLVISSMEEISLPEPAQEDLDIAIRHAQDARMRLGVARTLLLGKDPWAGE